MPRTRFILPLSFKFIAFKYFIMGHLNKISPSPLGLKPLFKTFINNSPSSPNFLTNGIVELEKESTDTSYVSLVIPFNFAISLFLPNMDINSIGSKK
jgi:hypothetical protein